MKRLLPLLLLLAVLFGAAACAEDRPTVTLPHSESEEKISLEESNSSTTTASSTSSATASTTTSAPTTTTSAPTTTTKKPPVTTTKKPAVLYTPTLSYTRLPENAGELYNSPAGGITGNENLYRKMVTAYLNYEKRVPIAENESPFAVLNMLRFHFPLFFADTRIEVDFASTLDYANITYTVSREEHFKIIENFEKRIRSLLAAPLGATDAEKALTAYLRFINTVDYDYPLADVPLAWDYLYYEDNPRYDEGYRALMEGKGVCSGFAIAYSFLLSQMDIDSYVIFADGVRDAHAWTTMKLSGKWYHADPTADGTLKTYSSPIYRFGETTTERVAAGYPYKNFRYSNYFDTYSFISATDERFHEMHKRQGHSPVIDLAGHSVSFKGTNGFPYTVSLQ